MKNVSNAALIVTAFSLLMSAPGCVGEDVLLDEEIDMELAPEDIAQDDGLMEAQGQFTVCNGSDGRGCVPTASNRYCIYKLNGDSTISEFACYNNEWSAVAYRDGASSSWTIVAAFDTLVADVSGNLQSGWVNFLIKNTRPCTASRKYERPNLAQPIFGNLNDSFIDAYGHNNPYGSYGSGCGRVRVWENVNFDGYSLACRYSDNPKWCDDLIDGALDLTRRVSSFRALDQ